MFVRPESRRALSAAYHLLSLAALWLIAWAKVSCGEINLPPLQPFSRVVINLLYLNLAISYWVVLKAYAEEGLAVWTWIAWSAVLLALCGIWPVFSGDLMEYLIRGRILGVYGKSPYAHIPAEFPEDMLYPHSIWLNNPGSYGPLFVFVETVPALLAPGSARAMVWIQKAILAVSLGAAVWFFAAIIRATGLGSRGKLVAAFAMNPLLVVSTVVDGHNDTIMVAFALGSVWLYLRRRYSLSFFFLTLGFLIKYTVFLTLPLLAVLVARAMMRRDGKFPWLFFAREAAWNVLVILAAFAPLWAGRSTFLALIRASTWFYTNTLPYAFRQASALVGLDLPEAVFRYGFLAVFAVTYATVLVRAARGELDEPVRFFRALCAIYLAFYLSITLPFGMHYLLWGLPWLLLARWPLENLLVLLYSFAGLFSYFKRMNYLLLLAAAAYGTALAWRAWRSRARAGVPA